MDYSKTVNLPKTDFPMKANLPNREPEIQRRWAEMDLYSSIRNCREGRPKFILHDGPPYANGNLHIGHALNKILKDIIVKFVGMRGFDSPFVPGWDTHGLPIEHAALKALGVDRRQLTPLELRGKCHEYALKYRDIQREQFKRFGVLGDWDNPYMTLYPEYEAKQIEVFGRMAREGYIYKGLKTVYWCAVCETALAEAEVEYNDRRSHSIYVAFDVTDGLGRLPTGAKVVIWTTTPWTLPANLGIAVHPEFAYGLYETSKGKLLLARDLAGAALKAMGLEGDLIAEFRGGELENILTKHPLFDRASRVIVGEHVTLEQGTGCVHTAPGHGPEDFEIGQKYRLGILNPVNERGIFTEEAGRFAGLYYEKANPNVLDALVEAGALLAQGEVEHSYAHCWRCKQPILYRATEQWFASVEGFRRQALEEIGRVNWIPAWGEERIRNMVADRSDWCISRQRAWGVPIPIFYCLACGEPLINEKTIEAVAGLFRREGSDAWWKYESSQILPRGTACSKCGAVEFEKESDIMDVWFDSGSSHVAVLETRADLHWPADMYLEGSDQHRGWFQSSLLTSVATRGSAPYRSVLTHGFVVDGDGRKMSKSLGNVVDPGQVIKEYGADILRLWVASSDYKSDVRVSPDILKQLAEVYRKIRNTIRFLIGNLHDFNPDVNSVAYRDLPEIDRYALHGLQKLIERVTRSYESYEYHLLYHAIHNYCVLDLSSFYLDILKDRLYTSAPDSAERRSAQTVLYKVATGLTKIIAPVLSHTAEEIWGFLPKPDSEPASVHMAYWPEIQSEFIEDSLADRWERLRRVREQVSKALEEARIRKVIGTSLEAKVVLRTTPDLGGFLREYLADLPTVFIVSQVELQQGADAAAPLTSTGDNPDSLEVSIEKARGQKCERCWVFSEKLGTLPDHSGLCPRCSGVVTQP